MLFTDLVPDIIFAILAFLDISTVISIAQTCQLLHSLAFSKSVWIALVEDLRLRSILDYGPNLQESSVDELIQLVKRTVLGPDSWLSGPRMSAVVAQRKIHLHPPMSSSIDSMPRLLPSGRHVFLNNSTILECWSVAEDRLVWRHKPAVEYAQVLQYAVEEKPAEGSVVIMICERTFPPSPDVPRSNYVEIIQLDLDTGGIMELLFTLLPGPTVVDNPFYLPVICGAVAAVATSSSQAEYLFLNWVTRSSLALTCTCDSPECLPQITLIPGHILFKTYNPFTAQDELLVAPLTALKPHWQPFLQQETGTLIAWSRDIVFAADLTDLTIFSDPFLWKSIARVSVFANPLKTDAYRVWVYYVPLGGETIPASHRARHWVYFPRASAYQSYALTVATACQWQRCAPDMPPTLRNREHSLGVTYAGHTFVATYTLPITRRLWVVPRDGVSEDGGGDEHISLCRPEDECSDGDVSPFGGAVTFAKKGGIVLSYFD
ncbi:hypothetical protein FB45DRAFT_1067264 [Roridomyces roridus]|uniref:F-box domain-containing protein n=1 Tax=Roridomyces roridus TaxID=1738132 RepID=A0AAD7B3M3_9AGAR|nr:hypothetical protein FB45DRAFT_1067264 [Roridomyces roridus]